MMENTRENLYSVKNGMFYANKMINELKLMNVGSADYET